LPRIKCTFAEFIDIICANGFTLERTKGTSHRQYRGVVNGVVCKVTVACHRLTDEIKPGTLQSMIRQSGLPKSLFRK
jgi:predicted RNA binding protein YcfA (HicA-like mRNA interferase family)